MIYIRRTTKSDCHHLMSNLRSHDRDEIEALGGVSAGDLWSSCKKAHEVHTVWSEDGDMVCIFGVQPEGIVWLLGTPFLDCYMITLCRMAPAFIARWSSRFPTLFNMTDKRNTRIILWLRWLGFTLGNDIVVNGHTFVHFHKASPCATQ